MGISGILTRPYKVLPEGRPLGFSRGPLWEPKRPGMWPSSTSWPDFYVISFDTCPVLHSGSLVKCGEERRNEEGENYKKWTNDSVGPKGLVIEKRVKWKGVSK